MRTSMLRAGSLAMASAMLLAGCGLADARKAAIAEAKVTPLSTGDSLRPGLVGMPDYPATGWGESGLTTGTGPSAAGTGLQDIGLQASDLASTLTVRTEPDGTSLGIPTLDFCAASFPSEALRVKRVQRAAYDKQGIYAGISTEVVLYRDAAAAQQALREVTAARVACPSGKAVHTYDGHAIVFAFHPAPGPSNTPLVDASSRLIIHTTMKVDGSPQTAFLVYQIQGRVLAAMYAVDASGKPFPQTTLDAFYALAGSIALRLKANAPLL